MQAVIAPSTSFFRKRAATRMSRRFGYCASTGQGRIGAGSDRLLNRHLIAYRPAAATAADHKLSVAQEMPVAERMRVGRDVLLNLNRLAAQAEAA